MKLLASKQNLAKPGPIHVFSMWHTQRTRENVFIFYKDIFTQPDPIWMCLEFFFKQVCDRIWFKVWEGFGFYQLML